MTSKRIQILLLYEPNTWIDDKNLWSTKSSGSSSKGIHNFLRFSAVALLLALPSRKGLNVHFGLEAFSVRNLGAVNSLRGAGPRGRSHQRMKLPAKLSLKNNIAITLIPKTASSKWRGMPSVTPFAQSPSHTHTQTDLRCPICLKKTFLEVNLLCEHYIKPKTS